MTPLEFQTICLFCWIGFVAFFVICVFLAHDWKSNKKLKDSFDAEERKCNMNTQHIG